MDERARRIGENEALFRTVNEQIESLNRGRLALGLREMDIVCECGDLHCAERIGVSAADYERIRSDPVLFLVRPGHELPDVEDLVATTPEYDVVRKHDGSPARLARATNPRG